MHCVSVSEAHLILRRVRAQSIVYQRSSQKKTQSYIALITPAKTGIIAAVAARDHKRAHDYAKRHHIPTTHPSYKALLNDPQYRCRLHPSAKWLAPRMGYENAQSWQACVAAEAFDE